MRRSHHRWQTPHRSPCTRQKAPRISSQGTPALSPEALASFHLSDRASPKAAYPKNACPAHLSARRPRYARRSCASPHALLRATSPPRKDVRQTDPRQYRSMLNTGKPLKNGQRRNTARARQSLNIGKYERAREHHPRRRGNRNLHSLGFEARIRIAPKQDEQAAANAARHTTERARPHGQVECAQ